MNIPFENLSKQIANSPSQQLANTISSIQNQNKETFDKLFKDISFVTKLNLASTITVPTPILPPDYFSSITESLNAIPKSVIDILKTQTYRNNIAMMNKTNLNYSYYRNQLSKMNSLLYKYQQYFHTDDSDSLSFDEIINRIDRYEYANAFTSNNIYLDVYNSTKETFLETKVFVIDQYNLFIKTVDKLIGIQNRIMINFMLYETSSYFVENNVNNYFNMPCAFLFMQFVFVFFKIYLYNVNKKDTDD